MTTGQIKKLRERLRESRVTFAQRFAVSPRTVEAWEQGLRRPSRLVLRDMVELVKDNREVEAP